ncbi:hypothetical protein LguiB_005545 [Lonicera macranthoides]
MQSQSRPTKFTIRVKSKHNNDITGSTSTLAPVVVSHSRDQTEQMNNKETPENDLIESPQKPETITSSDEEDENCGTQDEDSPNNENANNQIVVYSPTRDDSNNAVVDANPIGCRPFQSPNGKLLPSVGAFTVQCAKCFKWRLIPTKEKYEEIREHILEQPFVCEAAREWRPEISCEDEADIKQDGSRLWAIDKPNIAQPPPGWQRLLRIRSKESSKFADVYLLEHPEYMEGVSMSQFSFQIPRPLQKNYVKRKSLTDAARDADNLQIPEADLIPADIAPISAVVPPWNPGLRLGGPGYRDLYEPMNPSAKKARRIPQNPIQID